jgi:hypothetical protein
MAVFEEESAAMPRGPQCKGSILRREIARGHLEKFALTTFNGRHHAFK